MKATEAINPKLPTGSMFRRKPGKPVEAWQYTQQDVDTETAPHGMCNSMECHEEHNFPHVHTMHAGQIVKLEVGDWILPEPDGKHFYPVKDEVFQDTYEKV
jgi:hypothetical protein